MCERERKREGVGEKERDINGFRPHTTITVTIHTQTQRHTQTQGLMQEVVQNNFHHAQKPYRYRYRILAKPQI